MLGDTSSSSKDVQPPAATAPHYPHSDLTSSASLSLPKETLVYSHDKDDISPQDKINSEKSSPSTHEHSPVTNSPPSGPSIQAMQSPVGSFASSSATSKQEGHQTTSAPSQASKLKWWNWFVANSSRRPSVAVSDGDIYNIDQDKRKSVILEGLFRRQSYDYVTDKSRKTKSFFNKRRRTSIAVETDSSRRRSLPLASPVNLKTSELSQLPPSIITILPRDADPFSDTFSDIVDPAQREGSLKSGDILYPGGLKSGFYPSSLKGQFRSYQRRPLRWEGINFWSSRESSSADSRSVSISGGIDGTGRVLHEERHSADSVLGQIFEVSEPSPSTHGKFLKGKEPDFGVPYRLSDKLARRLHETFFDMSSESSAAVEEQPRGQAASSLYRSSNPKVDAPAAIPREIGSDVVSEPTSPPQDPSVGEIANGGEPSQPPDKTATPPVGSPNNQGAPVPEPKEEDEDAWPNDPTGKTKRKRHRGVILPTYDHTTQHRKDDHAVPRSRKMHERLRDGFQKIFFPNQPVTPQPLQAVPHRAIKKVVLIGVHGWFPPKVFETITGPRKGTSAAFCFYALRAVKKYFKEVEGVEFEDVDITTIPLELESMIEDRAFGHLHQILRGNTEPPPSSIVADMKKSGLRKLRRTQSEVLHTDSEPANAYNEAPDRPYVSLRRTSSFSIINREDADGQEKKEGKVGEGDTAGEPFEISPWTQAIMEADLVLVSAHSQGVPVSVILIDLLYEMGLLVPGLQRVCDIAMAGVWHGPFPSLQSVVRYFDTPAGNELFDMCSTDSGIGQKVHASLAKILSQGVRVVVAASWFDDVVPFYSGILHSVEHPLLFRAVYIDDKITNSRTSEEQVDFLTHLVVFCLKLRNKGISDHGLSVYLSKLIAGTFMGVSSGGHSTLYEEEETYLLGISYALNTADLATLTPMRLRPFNSPMKMNPYGLTFSMARLVGNPHILADSELKEELVTIVSKYDEWMPKDQELRSAKFALEGLKAASLRERLGFGKKERF